ncbi:hypothetical protein DY000_02010783 [Brassica cretica]|uniref:MCM OB domain-containing protein n=1 Tax=Brassica cretica TaxID=69181 RepID=A0ABQ7D3M2_BRACR|nr:hypothetical protein DY000_02010783 [Brassica cretica]
MTIVPELPLIISGCTVKIEENPFIINIFICKDAMMRFGDCIYLKSVITTDRLEQLDENRGTLVVSAMVTMMQPCLLSRHQSSAHLCIVCNNLLHLLSSFLCVLLRNLMIIKKRTWFC